MKAINIAALVAIVAILGWVAMTDSKVVKDVKSGVATLECDMKQGYMKIDPEMVVDFYPDQNYWKFTNGGSKSCTVVRN